MQCLFLNNCLKVVFNCDALCVIDILLLLFYFFVVSQMKGLEELIEFWSRSKLQVNKL